MTSYSRSSVKAFGTTAVTFGVGLTLGAIPAAIVFVILTLALVVRDS